MGLLVTTTRTSARAAQGSSRARIAVANCEREFVSTSAPLTGCDGLCAVQDRITEVECYSISYREESWPDIQARLHLATPDVGKAPARFRAWLCCCRHQLVLCKFKLAQSLESEHRWLALPWWAPFANSRGVSLKSKSRRRPFASFSPGSANAFLIWLRIWSRASP